MKTMTIVGVIFILTNLEVFSRIEALRQRIRRQNLPNVEITSENITVVGVAGFERVQSDDGRTGLVRKSSSGVGVPDRFVVWLVDTATARYHKNLIDYVENGDDLFNVIIDEGSCRDPDDPRDQNCLGQNDFDTRRYFVAKSVSFDELEVLALRSEVDWVEQNEKVNVSCVERSTIIPSTTTSAWNLDYIDGPDVFGMDKKYRYPASAGEGVDAYILDTGITILPDFEDRISWAPQTFCKMAERYGQGPCTVDKDLDGHGTHVAGTVGSKTYGVAKKSTIIGVKVLNDNGGGNYAELLQALNWVKTVAKKRGRPFLINMSLSGPRTAFVNNALEKLTSEGIILVVAAGNENKTPVQPLPHPLMA